MRPVLFASLLFLAVVSVSVSTSASAAGGEVMTWTISGVPRQATVFAPTKNRGSKKVPLIFAFHGHGDNMDDFAAATLFYSVWPEAIVVYPQGLPTDAASDPQGFGWIYRTDADGQRDLQFFDAVLATLREKFPVDNRRIYATGFSNGGMFTYVLWGARAKIFAAFAVVAGRLAPDVHLNVPKPVLAIAGRQDNTVLFREQMQAIKAILNLDNGDRDGHSCGPNCTVYSTEGAPPVITYIHGGGHVIPSEAPGMIVQFFKSHSLGE